MKTVLNIARKCLLTTLLTAVGFVAQAQFFNRGAEPFSTKWYSLESEHYRLIYPRGVDSLAREYLYNFELTRDSVMASILSDPAKFTLVLHPYALNQENALALAPDRVDLFTTPQLFTGTSDTHLRSSVLTQGRTIGQMQHYDQGIFKVLKYLGGEQTLGYNFTFRIKKWHLIGDAQHTASELSKSGPARDPQTLMYYRACALDGDERKYEQWRYGSYRHYTPDRKSFGYVVQTSMRYNAPENHYEAHLIDDFVNKWYDTRIWTKAFKKYTGNTGRRNFNIGMRTLSSFWKHNLAQRGATTPFTHLTDSCRYYTEYHSPTPLSDGRVIALKEGYQHEGQLIEISPDGTERRLRYFAPSNNVGRITLLNDSTIVWSEIVPDCRWELRYWSILRSMNLNSLHIRNLTHSTRLFSPAASPNGKMIAAVEYPLERSSRVVVSDAEGKIEEWSAEAPGKGQLKEIAWIGERIYAGCVNGAGWGLYSIDYGGDAWQEEIAPQTRKIASITPYGDEIAFATDHNGISNIYLYSPQRDSIYSMTNARHGAFEPNLKDGCIYFTDFDHLGYHPVKTEIDSLKISPVDFENPYRFALADILSIKAEKVIAESGITPKDPQQLRETIDNIAPEPYGKLEHGFHIHSWLPFHVSNAAKLKDLNFSGLAPGVTVIAQNLTGTLEAQIGYSYQLQHGIRHFSDGLHAGHLIAKYSGLPIILEGSVDYNDHRQLRYKGEYTDGEITYQIDTTSKPAFEAALKATLPFVINRSGWENSIIPEYRISYSTDEYSHLGDGFHRSNSMELALTFRRALPVTKTNLMPRLGIKAEARTAYSNGGSHYNGFVHYGQLTGYLPGITRQQGIKLTAAYQQHIGDNIDGLRLNLARLPRGYAYRPMQEYVEYVNKFFKKGGRNINDSAKDYRVVSLDRYICTTFEYAIPFGTGDRNFLGQIYLMRVYFIPFVDIAVNRAFTSNATNMYSYGAALMLDGHFFHLGAEVKGGIRYARIYDYTTGSWIGRPEFIIKTGL